MNLLIFGRFQKLTSAIFAYISKMTGSQRLENNSTSYYIKNLGNRKVLFDLIMRLQKIKSFISSKSNKKIGKNRFLNSRSRSLEQVQFNFDRHG